MRTSSKLARAIAGLGLTLALTLSACSGDGGTSDNQGGDSNGDSGGSDTDGGDSGGADTGGTGGDGETGGADTGGTGGDGETGGSDTGGTGGDGSSDPECGDDEVSGTEECDDGETADGDGCSASCAIEHGYDCSGAPSVCSTTCGDGEVAGAEECDDGGTADGNGCSASCVIEHGYACAGEPSACSASCGDGEIGGVEECDDGGTVDGNGCSASCAVEHGYDCSGEPSVCSTTCGDGEIGGIEECDDGGTVDGNGCSASCVIEDGYDCDGEPSVCSTTCGDGEVAGAEECDDGGTADGNGCSASCLVEHGYDCDGEPSACSTTCGDGEVAGAEECDDGGAVDGNGCSASCIIEDGFACADEPTVCDATCAGLPAGVETHRDPATDHCYVHIAKSQNWNTARALCQQLGAGADLAALSTEAERTAVNASGWTMDSWWLGGTDAAAEGVWVWSNGEAWTDPIVPPGSGAWAPNEPNDDGNQDCLHGVTGNQWDDQNCPVLVPDALCELPTSPVFGCGDGFSDPVLGGTEICDDGDTDDTNTCSNSCEWGGICDGATCHAATVVNELASPQPIPDGTYDGTLASMGCVPLEVTGAAGAPSTLTDVWVALNMSHTYIGELVIKLVSPAGTVVTLMSHPGALEATDDGAAILGPNGDLVFEKQLVFRDGAATSAEDMDSGNSQCGTEMSCAFAPNAGAATPGTLASLAGQDPLGIWQLCGGDSATFDSGLITRVALSLF